MVPSGAMVGEPLMMSFVGDGHFHFRVAVAGPLTELWPVWRRSPWNMGQGLSASSARSRPPPTGRSAAAIPRASTMTRPFIATPLAGDAGHRPLDSLDRHGERAAAPLDTIP